MAVPPVSGLADRAFEVLMGRSGRESRDLTEQEWAERIEQEAKGKLERQRIHGWTSLELISSPVLGYCYLSMVRQRHPNKIRQ